MSSFVFRCIGDKTHGMGHVVRDLILAGELRARGHDVRFISELNTPGLDRIKAAGFPWRSPGRWYSDGAIAYNEDVYIFDLEHGPALDDLREARGAYPCVVNIGGVGFHIDNPADIAGLVDLEIYGGELFRRPADDRLLAGPPYLIIDPLYRECRPNYYSGHVIVSMGGADPHGLTAPTVAALSAIGRRVRAIIGPAAMPIGTSPKNCDVYYAPLTLRPHLAGAALCITATGMTAYESLAAGVPVILTSWSTDHLETAAELERRFCAVNLGEWRLYDPADAAEVAAALLGNPARLDKMGTAGRDLIDGRGVYRVADALEKLTIGERHAKKSPSSA